MTENESALVWQARPAEDVLQELLPAETAAEEARALADELPEIRRRFEGGPEVVRRNLSEMTTFLRASEADVGRLMGRGVFRNMWHRLTGQQARDEYEIRRNLTRVQARALCVTERLLERQEYLEHATRFVGARLELLSMENLKLKAALVRLGQRIFDRVEGLEDRVARLEQRSDSLERRVSLTELFQSGFSTSAQMPYAQIIDPLERVLRLAMDFSKASGGEWRPIDYHRLELMALREANVTDDIRFSTADLVNRAANLRDARLLEWLAAGRLQERLMAPPEEDDARSFYPIHFLLQRPQWFIKQGLPRAGLQIISDEIGKYGLNPNENLGLWQIAQLLLEERLAWTMESGELLAAQQEKAALPAPQTRDLGVHTLRSLPVGDVAVQDLFLVADELLILGWMRSGAELSLMHLSNDGMKRISRQPNWNRATEGSIVPGGNSLWMLSPDRRGADGWIFDPQATEEPFVWRSVTLPSGSVMDGLAARGAALAGWRMNRVYLRDSKGDFFDHPIPRRVVSCAAFGGGLYILDDTELYYWRPTSDVFTPLGRLTDGLVAQSLTSSASGGKALVYARDRQGSELLIVFTPTASGEAEQSRQFFQQPIQRFAFADDEHVLVQTADGCLWRWSQIPSEERMVALAPAGHERFDLLATDGQGCFAGLDRAEGVIHVFHVICR